MVSQTRRYPDPGNYSLSQKTETKGLASNSTIYCPELKHFNCICVVCYNCELGFNGICSKLNERIKDNPLIIKELYRPIPDLFKQEYDSNLLACDGKIMSIGTKRDRRKKMYPLKDKFLLKVRFIPRYEEVELPYLDELFYKEGEKEPFSYKEVAYRCKSEDTVYTVNQDSKDLEIIKLMEKLNVRDI
jgi:hypothetical protein